RSLPVQPMMRLRTLLIPLLLLAMTGCSLFGDKNRFDAQADVMSVEQLYEEANVSMQKGNYDRAIRFYRGLIARFPFGSYSEQSQLDLAYCQYKRDQDDEAVATLNRFLKAHPTHPKVDYALFLRGLVNFDRNASMLDRVLPNEISTRDQQALRQAFIDFSELIKRYPSSAYAGDARQRMVYLRNSMAEFEMNVARYYYRRGAYVAAASRAAYVVENYQRTPQSLDALELMASSYDGLNEPALAEDVRRVLSLTAPERERAIEERKSWWRRWLPFG
ncbi:MAG: outer membrane protein assembly factor BamD, partial [Xanthomonadales bacterium]|nr:outer membrane protein assembly factor BamD [Xanthomonadales bacterium]